MSSSRSGCRASFRLSFLREYPDIADNWRQLTLLIAIDVLCACMLGLERAAIPVFGEVVFKIHHSTMMTFIIAFGLSKAVSSLVVGELADRLGRKTVLLIGWSSGVPVYLMIALANSWGWVISANVLLGVQQGFTAAAIIYMMLDQVDKSHDGTVLGVNQFFAYMSIGITTFVSGIQIHATHDFQTLFFSGVAVAAVGLLLSLFTKDTRDFALRKAAKFNTEEKSLLDRDSQHGGIERNYSSDPTTATIASSANSSNNNNESSSPNHQQRKASGGFFYNLWDSFVRISFGNSHVFICCFCGFLNSVRDGILWGLVPIFFRSFSLGMQWVSLLIAVYPISWAVFQLFAGYLYDRHGAKWLVATGLWLESLAVVFILWTPNALLVDLSLGKCFIIFMVGSVLLGLGTALTYPTLHVAVAHGVPAELFTSAVGIYKMYRELGYAFGALQAGLVADAFGVRWAISTGAVATLVGGTLAAIFIKDHPSDEAITTEDMKQWFGCGSKKVDTKVKYISV